MFGYPNGMVKLNWVLSFKLMCLPLSVRTVSQLLHRIVNDTNIMEITIFDFHVEENDEARAADDGE